MSNGKRYKSNDNDLDLEEEKDKEDQYQKIIEEISNKNNTENETLENQKDKDTKKYIEKGKSIEIKEEIERTTERILEQIEKKANINKDEEKIEEIKETFKNFEKENNKSVDEVLFVGSNLDNKSSDMSDLKTKTEKENKNETKNENEKNNIKENKNNTNNIKEKRKKRKTPKSLKIIGNIFYYIIFIIVLLFLAVIIVQRYTDNEVAVGGYRLFNILTGSMEPEYQVGDVLLSRTIEPKDIQMGDDIVYKGKEKPFEDLVVTHRVVDLNENEDGTYSFITRGIANDVDDPEINESQIYGKIIYKVELFSLLAKGVNNMYVFFFVIFLPIVVLISIKIIQVKSEKIFEEYNEQ